MFSFDKLITPKIITVLYILTLIVLFCIAIFCLLNGALGMGCTLIVMAIFSRIFFESIMVSFKNNEYLRRITQALESRQL